MLRWVERFQSAIQVLQEKDDESRLLQLCADLRKQMRFPGLCQVLEDFLSYGRPACQQSEGGAIDLVRDGWTSKGPPEFQFMSNPNVPITPLVNPTYSQSSSSSLNTSSRIVEEQMLAQDMPHRLRRMPRRHFEDLQGLSLEAPARSLEENPVAGRSSGKSLRGKSTTLTQSYTPVPQRIKSVRTNRHVTFAVEEPTLEGFGKPKCQGLSRDLHTDAAPQSITVPEWGHSSKIAFHLDASTALNSHPTRPQDSAFMSQDSEQVDNARSGSESREYQSLAALNDPFRGVPSYQSGTRRKSIPQRRPTSRSRDDDKSKEDCASNESNHNQGRQRRRSSDTLLGEDEPDGHPKDSIRNVRKLRNSEPRHRNHKTSSRDQRIGRQKPKGTEEACIPSCQVS